MVMFVGIYHKNEKVLIAQILGTSILQRAPLPNYQKKKALHLIIGKGIQNIIQIENKILTKM